MPTKYPKIEVRPANSKNNVINGFRAAVSLDEYYNKFIYFGPESDLTTYAQGVSSKMTTATSAAGLSQVYPQSHKEVYWFGKFNSTTSPLDSSGSPTSDASNAILQVGHTAGMWREGSEVYFKAVFDKNPNSNDEYRFIAFVTLNQIRLQGNPRVAAAQTTSLPTAIPPGPPEGNYPSSSNISMTNSIGNRIVRIRLGDFPLYVAVASKIFLDLEQRIKHYDIKFDRPFVPSYYVGLLRQVDEQLKALITGNNIKIDNRSFVEFEFTSDFKSLVKLFFIKAPPAGTVWRPRNADEYIELQHASSRFSNQTLNSFIASLGALYNKYQTTTQSRTPMAAFRNKDEVRLFIKTYIVPAPSIATSDLTTNLIEKFILGDTQLLDDEYFDNYMTNPPQMALGFKKNLNDEISKQYESIGDFLGLQWANGKFSEIRDINDVYDKLLNHINIPDLIKLASKCLLKLIPLDELLDEICDWVLQRDDDGNTWFSKHLEGITQELENMDDGLAKDLAKELGQVYFQLLDFAIEETIEVGGNALEVGGAWLAELLADAMNIGVWANVEESKLAIEKIRSSIVIIVKTLADGERSLLAQKSSLQGRISELQTAKTQLDGQLAAFQGNIPSSHQSTMDYYNQKLQGTGEAAEGGKSLLAKEITINQAINNAKEQLRLYNFLVPSEITRASLYGPPTTAQKTFLHDVKTVVKADIEAANFKYIIPNLVVLNPYIKDNTKVEIFKTILKMDAPSPDKAVENLYAFNEFIKNTSFTIAVDDNIKTTWGDGFVFNPNYTTQPDNSNEKITNFKLNLSNIKKILQHIQALTDAPSAPGDALNSLANFGADTMNDYFDEIFQDQAQRNRLCLAIMGAIPGVGYLIYQLIDDPSQVGDWFVDQGTALYDGFSKRLEMFTKTDYPINDILKELGDSLIQIGLNLATDLLINGILFTLETLRKSCEDAEKINAPYNPMGAVDLSGFITNSRTGPNNTTKGIEDSDGFKIVVAVAPDITVGQFSRILTALSEAFSINEMCKILNNRAPAKSYSKAISVIKTFSFLKDTKFYSLYVNDLGIREFFKLLSKDIEPAFCAQAINNYEREKSLLLKICFGKDDAILEQVLCKDIPPEECLKLLSTRAELPMGLVHTLLGQINNFFQPQTPLGSCADNKTGLFDPSQKYSADKIGNSIFGSLESYFENDISRIKDIYLKTGDVYKDPKFFSAGAANMVKDIVSVSLKKPGARTDEDIKTIMPNATAAVSKYEGNTVAPDVFYEIIKLLSETEANPNSPHAIAFKKLPTGDIKFKSLFEIEENLNKAIDFTYDASPPSEEADDVTLRVTLNSSTKEDQVGDVVLAEYSANKILAEELSPENSLFNPEYGVATLSTYYFENIKKEASQYALDQDFYMLLLNSIFRDLLYSSLKLGFYDKKEFNKLQLNKHLSIDGCFLGFMNKKVLNKQMQKLAESLTCYAPDSATKGPVNVATIKIALDCVIRTIAVKEIMKSLFVYGIFPTELKEDNERSFYDQFINKEIEESIKRTLARFFPSGNAFEGFYNEVLKEFITDIMRIIYQKDSLTDQESFDIIKNAQINFVKQQLKYVVSKEFATTFTETTEYQLLESVLNPEDEDNIDPFLSLSEMSYVDRIQALQNDQLTLYLDSFKYSANESINAPTRVIHSDDAGTLSAPVIFRETRRETEYFDFTSLELNKSADIGLVLQANPNGIGMERLIEIKHNANFLSDLPIETIQYFDKLLMALGDSKIMGSQDGRKHLVGFLYETKLIMLFPQLHSIVQSMLSSAPTALWTDYIDGGGDTNIFFTMYLMNYKSEDFLEAYPDVYEKYINDGNLDWQYSGKYYLNDIENLISSFYYPNVDNSMIPPGDNSKEFLSLSQDKYIDLYVPKSVENAPQPPWYQYPLNKTWTAQLLKFIAQKGIMPNWMENYLLGNEVVWGIPGQSFFEWLYKKPVKDILDINSVLRLAGYIKRENDDLKFVDFAGEMPAVIFKETMVKEKMGNVGFQSYDFDTGEPIDWTGAHEYFCFPLFEAKHAIPPDISWCSFFGLLDKAGGLRTTWYNQLFESITVDTPLSEALFSPSKQKPCGSFDCIPLKDIFSFIYRFKALTGLNVIEQQKVFVTKYESTWWWNIRGVSVSKEQILEHIKQGGGAIPNTDNHNFSHWDDNPFVYLSKASYASLIEDGNFFFDESGTRLSNGIYAAPNAAGGGGDSTYVSGVKNDDGSDAADEGLWVGEFTTHNPVTMEEVVLPKFIRPRRTYTNSAGKLLWIDLGWWGSHSQTSLIESLNYKYPGAEFDPYGVPYRWLDPPLSPIGVAKVNAADKQGLSYKGFTPWTQFAGAGWWFPSMTGAWHAYGKIRGGVTSAEAQEIELKLEGISPLSAYSVFSKMLGPAPNVDKDLFRRLLKSFFIKEQTTIISLIHKFMVEKYYPQLDDAFNATLDACVDVLFAAIASANGDYQYTSKNNSTAQPAEPSLDFGMITGQILKMFFGAMANTVDPTWRTQWFMPGPFTPFGVVAKLLDENGDIFKSSPASSTSSGKALPVFCNEEFEEQAGFFDVKVDDAEKPE